MDNMEFKYMRGMHSILQFILYFYTRIFSIRANITKEVKEMEGPYLLLANHIGTWDPFVIGYFLKQPIHFVSSDAVFRDKFMRHLLKRMGVIPKKKNVKDTRVVRIMINHTREGKCLGLFPEASRSWVGRTMNIDPATAKLIKLLNVPVVTAKMKGMQLFNPRWGTHLRKTKVDIDYQLSLSREQIKALSEQEILEHVKEELAHNEVEHQRKVMHGVYSRYRAEYISYVLFTCPECKESGHIRSKHNKFSCGNCFSKWTVDKWGFFKGEGHESQFDNIIDWFDWQLPRLEAFVEEAYEKNIDACLFKDEGLKVFKQNKIGFARKGIADILFFIDRIEFHYRGGKKKTMMLTDIETLSPQLRERIEISYKGMAFRLVGKRKGISGLRWEIACNSIWKKLGQEHKLSTYFKSN